jgi:hypothetical protein
MSDGVDASWFEVSATKTGYSAQSGRVVVTKSRNAPAGGGAFVNGAEAYIAVYQTNGPGETATASAKLWGAGQITTNDDGVGDVLQGHWYYPPVAGAGDDVWVKALLASGTAPTAGPALGSWHRLDVARQWDLSLIGWGSVSCVLSLSYAADSGGATVLGSGTLGLSSTQDSA